jgi:hypothetical protein
MDLQFTPERWEFVALSEEGIPHGLKPGIFAVL